ncbi:hypothetical protein CCR75_004833 [Bremia lactucae]|uniref:Crinkler effector protein N-terminal domain-containing protein n=1 Tax=Bremia lactucae TaxID=4779 RepID=A0A976FI21_BRELC|nr:hypothetical protein CCR75_004833 [Bremia lactucae]
MDEVKVICAVYGEGYVFSMKIARDANVAELQKAIVNERKNFNDRFKVDPVMVALYLAKKNGVWLKDDIYVKDFLKAGRSVEYDEMRPSYRLTTAALLGPIFQPNEGEIHVLVELPDAAAAIATTQGSAQAADVLDVLNRILRNIKTNRRTFERSRLEYQELSCKDKKTRRETKEIESQLLQMPDESYTDGAFGEMEIERLGKLELITDFAARHGEPFWRLIIQPQANAFTNEALFDAFITPFFSEALANWNMVFVNSEQYAWLTQSTNEPRSTDLKPDGFVTHPGMFRAKEKPNDNVAHPTDPTFRFGVAEKDLFDCVILFESKLSLTSAAFGRVARYLQKLRPEASGSAILYDRHSFWMINSHASVVLKVQKAKWTDGGSESLFQNFICANMSPWIPRLTMACSLLGVKVVEGDAFLGRGTHGCVFKVIGEGGEHFALKLVETRFSRFLYRDEEALKQAQNTGLTVHLAGNCIDIHGGAALLLSPVGKPLPRPTTRSDVATLYRLLWQLHDRNLVHGDPRVANVILYREQPLWIDFLAVQKANFISRMVDTEILTRSVLHVSRDVQLGNKLEEMITKYGRDSTPESLNRLIEVVFQRLDSRLKGCCSDSDESV